MAHLCIQFILQNTTLIIKNEEQTCEFEVAEMQDSDLPQTHCQSTGPTAGVYRTGERWAPPEIFNPNNF